MNQPHKRNGIMRIGLASGCFIHGSVQNYSANRALHIIAIHRNPLLLTYRGEHAIDSFFHARDRNGSGRSLQDRKRMNESTSSIPRPMSTSSKGWLTNILHLV